MASRAAKSLLSVRALRGATATVGTHSRAERNDVFMGFPLGFHMVLFPIGFPMIKIVFFSVGFPMVNIDFSHCFSYGKIVYPIGSPMVVL